MKEGIFRFEFYNEIKIR